MKNKIMLSLIMFIVVLQACKKADDSETDTPVTYSSVDDFFEKNAVPLQTYTVNGGTGGNFITPQGTTVFIPASAFTTQAGMPVTGNVTIQFKDLYKKSDMLLSRMPPMTSWGGPLKSGGEFFIKAIFNGSPVKIANGKKINVVQPVALTGEKDTAMQPFDFQADSAIWYFSGSNSLLIQTSNYIFSLYDFSTPADSGTWCNSDNMSFFSAFTPTTLTLHAVDNVNLFHPDVFLVFKGVNSMVHVYRDQNNINEFPYWYAPVGLQCTAVCIGVKDEKLYSSFVPVTISANQTINFSLTETTTDEFKNQLSLLN